MSPQVVFFLSLACGYVAWILVYTNFIRQRFALMSLEDVQRAIAAFQSFRFFGLMFIVPGLAGNLSPTFTTFAAYGDFATGVLAMLALLTVRIRALFWFFVVAFNAVGAIDIIVDYVHGTQIGLGDIPGQLGMGYAVVMIYIPALMITHVVAFAALRRRKQVPSTLSIAHES